MAVTHRRPLPPRRSKSCSSPDLSVLMSKGLDCLPNSPDGVITYMGRSYEVKELFPSVAANSTNSAARAPTGTVNKRDLLEDDDSSCQNLDDPPPPPSEPPAAGKKSPVSHIIHRRRPRPARRSKSCCNAAGGHASLSPIRRPLPRAKSAGSGKLKLPGPPPGAKTLQRPKAPMRSRSGSGSSLPTPRRSPARSRSGSALTHMMQALQVNDGEEDLEPKRSSFPSKPAALMRSKSLGESFESVKHWLATKEEANDMYGIHSNSMRNLNYTKADVANIIDDQEEFERLKATLKKKGAITNGLLEQRIHFYVKAMKDRDAGLLQAQQRRRRRSTSGGQRVRRSQRNARSKDPDDGPEPALMRRGTIGIINSNR